MTTSTDPPVLYNLKHESPRAAESSPASAPGIVYDHGHGHGHDQGLPLHHRPPPPQLHEHHVIKRRRITKACDFCHRRGRKCKLPPGVDQTSSSSTPGLPSGHITCLTCVEHGATCTWTRVAAKRGVKSKSSPHGSSSRGGTAASPTTPSTPAVAGDDKAWAYTEARHGDPDLVRGLLRIFFDTVYPIFPFFAESLLLAEWDRCRLSSSRASFACLMAVCATSSCHVRDGAVFTLGLSVPVEPRHRQAYLEDARRAVPRHVPAADCFPYLQTLATLSLAAIQIGDAPLLHQSLGLYHLVVAQHNFHNESRWPPDLDPVERHVRRQFFWSMYRLEVHTALIMGHVVRCPEMQAAVAYPSMPPGLDGSLSTLSTAAAATAAAAAVSGVSGSSFPRGGWLIGWNYITDLYRVLEHVIVRFRARKIAAVDRGSLYGGYGSIAPPVDELLTRVLAQRDALPAYLARAQPPSHDIESNLCGFQVANIACTIQLLRMTSFSCQDVKFRDACRAATELIEDMSQTPVDYLRAIGSPMLQELAGVGHMLTSFIGRQLHPTEYQHLREVM
ncbi:hypothetical protein SODALDRAFT_5197 [Sodiomyces alkalinus F11]|uniref:Zn(2)-C6 fungal-type domain-containing protein n=1 Tax=Sodiomyces alkalinus (strain CBS 110278 / VKM F-3762 / F11) TaxID=1314773 RepID=A0A3N2Q5G6_SODAK|nr:hypothetical protein SODALDRAFT_5197 [Sodiomyces alkalinus F11]ROT42010.1 hypothetical protein SODALDRAFT_5197 [Sodiomyces alkalinus F11]